MSDVVLTGYCLKTWDESISEGGFLINFILSMRLNDRCTLYNYNRLASQHDDVALRNGTQNKYSYPTKH